MPTELATVLVMAVVSIGGSWLVATQTARGDVDHQPGMTLTRRAAALHRGQG